MARVTIEDCLKEIDNTFDICSLASKRAKDIASGAEPMVDCKDKPTVIALREIAEKKINMDYFDISNAEVSEGQLHSGISEEEVIEELGQQLDNSRNTSVTAEPVNADDQSPDIEEATDEITNTSVTAEPVNADDQSPDIEEATDEITNTSVTAEPVNADDQSPDIEEATDEITSTSINNTKPE
jgi:DNA-directed RNA polymerase subunit omega